MLRKKLIIYTQYLFEKTRDTGYEEIISNAKNLDLNELKIALIDISAQIKYMSFSEYFDFKKYVLGNSDFNSYLFVEDEMKKINKLIKNGKIKNEVEFYFLNEFLTDTENGIQESVKKKLENILLAYQKKY